MGPETERQILKAIETTQRRCGRAFPRTVSAWLDFYRNESTLRRDMVRMADEGKLIRLGERKGYILPGSRAHQALTTLH